MSLLWTPALLIGALLTFALAQLALARRYPRDTIPLVDALNAVLPQTQCAQCGYAGCRPYAEAVASGAPLDLCPPGGVSTHAALERIMGQHGGTPPAAEPGLLAVIDESECIGCTLCLPACPVDAIVGASGQMHTVILDECTGCELCVAPCPVDCISMVPAPPLPRGRRTAPQLDLEAPLRACIKCALCEPVCPVDLPVPMLIQSVRQGRREDAAAQGLKDCIECGLCDRACPSGINLAAEFSSERRALVLAAAEDAARDRFQQRYEAHATRQAAQTATAQARREARLARGRRWS